MLSVAERAPAWAGLNLTETVHVPPPDETVPQPDDVAAKSPALVPVTETPLTCRSAVPLLVIVTVLAALVVPTAWPPNERDGGLRATDGWVPVPLRLTT